MLLKPLKPKVRNGTLFFLNHFFKNDNYIELSWDWYSFGLGINGYIGDTRRYFYINFMWLHFEVWF